MSPVVLEAAAAVSFLLAMLGIASLVGLLVIALAAYGLCISADDACGALVSLAGVFVMTAWITARAWRARTRRIPAPAAPGGPGNPRRGRLHSRRSTTEIGKPRCTR